MKKRIVLMLAILCQWYFTTNAQDHPNLIDLSEVQLMKPHSTSKGVKINAHVRQVIEVLGQPNSISDFYSEVDEDILKVYHYGNTRVYFLKDSLFRYILKDASLWVGKPGGDFFKVGDKMVTTVKQVGFGPPGPDRIFRKEVSKSFHGFSFMDISSTKVRDKTGKTLGYRNLKDGDGRYDNNIELFFDKRDILTCIEVTEP